MTKRKESFFWTSYSDLMTSLFFIMMVLFILVIVLLHKRMEATEKQLEEIKRVEASTRDLEGHYFTYNDQYEKFVLNIKCYFPVAKYDISLLDDNTCQELMNAGRQIKEFLDKHNDNQYLVIVEGQASMNSTSWTQFNYELSYQRALSLIKFWAQNPQTRFSDKNCELQIAGSGDGRLNAKTMRDPVNSANQRFLIYIIPKNIIK